MRYYMGRAYRENRRAMAAALERNKDKVEAAMDDALKAVDQAGRAAGASLAAKRAQPAPGRIASKLRAPEAPVPDPLVNAVLEAMPGAKLVAVERVEPQRRPLLSVWPARPGAVPRPRPRLLRTASSDMARRSMNRLMSDG